MRVHIRMDTVHKIVRRHDGPRIGFAHRNLEWLEVNLPQWPLLNERVNGETVGLLFIANKIWSMLAWIREDVLLSSRTLDGCRNTLLLQSTYVLRS